jgi:hypothetical protein
LNASQKHPRVGKEGPRPQRSVLGGVLPGGTRSLSGPRGQCVGSGMGPKRSQNLPTIPSKLSESRGIIECQSKAPQGRTGGPAPSSTVCWGGSCRAVHGHFRAHVGSVWVRAWDQKSSTTCLQSPRSCPKAGGIVECQSKATQGRTGGPTPSNTVCWRGGVLPGGTRSLSGARGQCVGSGMDFKRFHNLPRFPSKLSQSRGGS